MNTQDGDSSVTRAAFQFGMTPSVAISAMNVMNSEAPSRAPRIGRNESDRYSKNESSQANLAAGTLGAFRGLDRGAHRRALPPPLPMAGSAMMSL